MNILKKSGIKVVGNAATITLWKKSRPGDGSYSKGKKGCKPWEIVCF